MASNPRAKAQNGQSRKMFNNFLDSLDISGAGQSTSGPGSTYNVARNKSIQSNGGKISNSTQAMRMVNNNSVQAQITGHGGVPQGPSGGGKRNKQLVSTSFNMAPQQITAQ